MGYDAKATISFGILWPRDAATPAEIEELKAFCKLCDIKYTAPKWFLTADAS